MFEHGLGFVKSIRAEKKYTWNGDLGNDYKGIEKLEIWEEI